MEKMQKYMLHRQKEARNEIVEKVKQQNKTVLHSMYFNKQYSILICTCTTIYPK